MDSRLILYSFCFVWHGLLFSMEQKKLHEWCKYAYQEQSKIENLKYKSSAELVAYAKKIHNNIKQVKKFIGSHNIKSIDNTLLPLYVCKQETLYYLYHKKRTPEYELSALSEIQSIATIKIRSRSSNYLDDPHYAHIVHMITALYKPFGGSGYESCKQELEKLRKRGNIPLQGKYNAQVEKEMTKKLCKLYKGINENKYLKYKAKLARLTRLHKYTHSSQEVNRQKNPKSKYSSSFSKKLTIIEDYCGKEQHKTKQKEEQTEPALHNSFCVTTLTGQRYSF